MESRPRPATLSYFNIAPDNVSGQRFRYSDWLMARRTGDRFPMGTRFSARVQIGPGAHPAPFTMGTGSFPGIKSGRGVTLTSHHLLVPWSRKSRAIPVLPLWVARPVQSLSALQGCTLPYLFNRKNVKFPLCIADINFSSPSQRDAVIWKGISCKPKQLLVSFKVCNIRTPRIGAWTG